MSVDIECEDVCAELPDGCRLRGLLYSADSTDAPVPLWVCLHGLGVDANVWRFVAPRLQARGISVLCLDLRGHGLSDRGGWLALTPGGMAADVYDACRCLGLEPSCLLGQSFGTCVALEILRRYGERLDIRSVVAVTPVWIGERKRLSTIPKVASSTIGFLRRLGRQVGYRAPRRVGRRDHTRYAAFPDSHMPRFADEAAAISWSRYAKLLVWLRLQAWRPSYDWKGLAGFPVRMIGASHDGLWNNRELEAVHRQTGWPLAWMEMRHVSLATDERYAAGLVALLEEDPGWPGR